jgi:hypothetical protein
VQASCPVPVASADRTGRSVFIPAPRFYTVTLGAKAVTAQVSASHVPPVRDRGLATDPGTSPAGEARPQAAGSASEGKFATLWRSRDSGDQLTRIHCLDVKRDVTVSYRATQPTHHKGSSRLADSTPLGARGRFAWPAAALRCQPVRHHTMHRSGGPVRDHPWQSARAGKGDRSQLVAAHCCPTPRSSTLSPARWPIGHS